MVATGSARRAGSAAFRFMIALSFFFAFLIFAAPPALAQEEQKQEGQEEEVVPADEKESEPPAKGITVSRMVICENVEEREPVGAADAFPSDVGALHCFSEIDRADPPIQIFHRWYIGDRLVNEIPITVRGSHWRCWSRKTIVAQWKGECRVEVATEAGDVLRVATFTLE
jgi:hypothetical protein